MDNIYKSSVDKVSQGARFRIDFPHRSFKLDGRYIIKDGKYEGELGIDKPDNPLKAITQLFIRYHHSLPSERSESKHHNYFSALPEYKLSDEDMLFGEPREVAQIKLELYVLIMILNGWLVWDEFAKGKWYWQSPEAKDFILLKEWLNPQNVK